MLRLFRNNSPFTVIILFIFALVVKFQLVLYPIMPEPVAGHFMYNYLLRALYVVFRNGAFAYTMLAIIVIFIQSLYLKSISIRHRLFPRYTYIPAFVYLLLTSIYPPFNSFSETLIVNWFLLGAVDIMFGFTQTTQPRKLIYNASFLLSMAALFQFTMLAYFFLLLVGMVMFRSFNLGEWSVALMGYATPPYFLVCILFLADRFHLYATWPHIGFSLSAPIVSPFYLIITLAGIGILLASGIYAMQLNVAMSNIYIRRDWIAISFYLIISVFVAILTDLEVRTAWMITLPALSIIISHGLLLETNKRFSNFIFYFSLIYLIFCLMANQ
ncbi:MAG: hypothetical protein ACHQD8_05365 [Chitinophagales bacterium]